MRERMTRKIETHLQDARMIIVTADGLEVFPY